jgi:2-oxoglutarate ferredoxin oxidoreductase subunit gamma
MTIRLAGYGGYGVVTASRLLGLAFAQKGFHVLQTESHGAAARGGACTADLTVSSSPIFEIDYNEPTILIVLSTSAFMKCWTYCTTLSREFLIIESSLFVDPEIQSLLSGINPNSGPQIFQINLDQLAKELGNVRYYGIAALGALAMVEKRIPLSLIQKTIQTDSRLKRFAKQNLRALQVGQESISSYDLEKH